jgi:uncharacterized Fe-S cluster-containing radical SAM superfamily enzyme
MLRGTVNKALKKLSYRLRLTRSWAYPSVFQIEATNFCNLRCPMCPYDTMTRDVGYMEIDLFRRVVDQLAGCTRVLRLHNMGESLFHKQIDELIRYARSKGVTTCISTNATALNEKAAERILTAQLDRLFISFDGAHKETYEMYRKGARFERSLANVLRFLEIKEKQQAVKPHTTISMIEMAGTEGEIGEFREFWQKRCGRDTDQASGKLGRQRRQGQRDRAQGFQAARRPALLLAVGSHGRALGRTGCPLLL